MNKQVVHTALLAFATLFVMNSFLSWWWKDSSNKPINIKEDASYVLPTQQDLQKPANREIDFYDAHLDRLSQPEITTVDTDLYRAVFSSHGGVINLLEFKKYRGRDGSFLTTMQSFDTHEHERGSFLVALPERTPYQYRLSDVVKQEKGIAVTYEVETPDVYIKKTYMLHYGTYQIDLMIEFQAHTADQTPRIFVPGPFVAEIENNFHTAVVGKGKGSGVSTLKVTDAVSQAWIKPSYFGVHDTYFAHVLINDPHHFVTRGYYREDGHQMVSAILEGSELPTEKKVLYTLSWYAGPRNIEAIHAVDSKLDGILSYGWFSLIAKALLQLINFLYSYVHNYGWAIVLLTLLIKLLFIPFSYRARLSRHTIAKQRKHQNAQVAYIKRKYAGDQARMDAELLRFYKEQNVLSQYSLGCLPMLVQIPIFFGLSRLLGSAIELYNAPFVGWINDLSLPDSYYVLPFIIAAGMFYITANDKNASAGGGILMVIFMPLMAFGLLSKASAGLNLYMAVNIVLTGLENTVYDWIDKKNA